MNRSEALSVATMVQATWPQRTTTDDTDLMATVWGNAIADCEYGEAMEAVRRIEQRGADRCPPGAVRREIARARHLLAPTADELLADLMNATADSTVDALHPIAKQARREQGGVPTGGTLLASFRQRLHDLVTQHDNAVLTRQPMPDAQQPQITVGEAQQRAIERARRERHEQQQRATDNVRRGRCSCGGECVPMPEYVREAWREAKERMVERERELRA